MAKCHHTWDVDRCPDEDSWIERCLKCGSERTILNATGKEPWRAPWEVMPQDLKNHRAVHRLTQVDLADILHTSVSTYQKWEQGVQRIPGIVGVTLKLLAEFQ